MIANALNISIDQLLFENLDYFTKNSGDLIIDKELSCLNITELNIILSMLRIYNDNHYKLLWVIGKLKYLFPNSIFLL